MNAKKFVQEKIAASDEPKTSVLVRCKSSLLEKMGVIADESELSQNATIVMAMEYFIANYNTPKRIAK